MSHQLQLDVPDEIYQSLMETAQATGEPVEELAIKWLASASKRLSSDPLEKWIGAISSPPEVRDWIENHDKYIGLEALDPHEDGEDG